MNPEIIESEILNLLGNHCSPGPLAGLVKDLRTVDAVENGTTGGNGGELKSGNASLVARDKLDQLITLCQRTLPQNDTFHIVLEIGDIFALHGELSRAEEFFTLVVVNGDEVRHKGAVADAYLKRGEVHSRQGRWKESTSDLRRSLRLFRDLRESESVARVENILGANYAEQGKLPMAQKFFCKALETFEHSRRPEMAATVMMNIGNICNIAGDIEQALVHYKRAQSQFESVGELRRLAELHHNMGMSYLRKKEYRASIREFDSSYNLSAKKRIVGLMGLASLGKATALYRLKDYPMALKLVNQAIGYCSFCLDRLSLADAYKVKGMIHREMHNAGFAESYLHTSLRINQELDSHLNMAETLLEIGLLEQGRGRAAQARGAVERACHWFKKVGATKELDEARCVLDELKRKSE